MYKLRKVIAVYLFAEKKHAIQHVSFPPQANASVPADSFLFELTRVQMSDQLPAMTEALKSIRARGLKTAVLTNNFYLESGESFLPIDRKQFDVVSFVLHKTSHFLGPLLYYGSCSLAVVLA